MGKTLNLSGEEMCALEHALEKALTAEVWIPSSRSGDGGGKWLPSHSGLHKTAFKAILHKMQPVGKEVQSA